MQSISTIQAKLFTTILFLFLLSLAAVRVDAANALPGAAVPGAAERGAGSTPALVVNPAVLVDGLVLQVRCETYLDDDGDGLDDGVENCALNKHAPLAYLPINLDWTRPANVDWYLTRSALRFHHSRCSDEQIVAIGELTQLKLVTRYHQRKKEPVSLDPCSHYGDYISSSSANAYFGEHHFFLQPNDATHAGSANSADWVVYGHVYPNDIGGMNVQYWFFYAYNDNFGSFNHEGDWESITLRLDPRGNVEGAYVCAHGNCPLRTDIAWHATSHPIIWVADGSHASYTSEANCDNAGVSEGGGDNCQTVGAHRWFTWRGGRGAQPGLQGGGVINVGERGRPLNNQKFIRYNANWGEVGTTSVTSGPRTPTFQASWTVGSP